MIADGLFEYQRRDVQKLIDILRRRGTALNGGDTGTGKTFTTCACARELGLPIFGIVPKAVVSDWFDVAEAVGAEIIGLTNYESAKNGKYYKLANEFMAEERSDCPYLRRERTVDGTVYHWDLPPCILVFDEAHRGKNNHTQTAKLMESARVLIERGCKIMILSATITDSVECFRTPAYLLGYAQLGLHAYRAWLRLQKPRKVPVRGGQLRDETIPEILHRIVYVDPDACGVRTRIRDLQADRDEIIRDMFRANDVCAQTYEMSAAVEAEIEAAHIAIQDALTALKTKQQTEECPLTIILRARQRIEMLKVPTLAMLAMEYIDQDKSVVLFVNFNETATRLFEQLDPFVQDEHKSFVTFINGSQSPEERRYNIQSFQQDRSRVMIANIRAGGIGVSLQDRNGRYGRVSLISPTWSSIELKQALGRIHRAGGLTPCIQRIVYCKGRVSVVGPKIADGVVLVDKDGQMGRAEAMPEARKQIEEALGNDTTFNSHEGKGKIGVEELMAENVNRKLRTIEWLNNGDDQDLYQF
jgi:superfamily II DNA or RNA helicase